MPAFRLGLPPDDVQLLTPGDVIEVAPRGVTIRPGLRKGWVVGELESVNERGIVVVFRATGRRERFTHEEKGLGWRRAGS